MTLSLMLLGGLAVRDGRGTPLSLPTRKVSGLLAYLAVHADQPHSREQLMTLLWCERGERQARQSLNHALRSIRKLESSLGVTFLQTNGDQVTLLGDAIGIDILQFQELAADRPAEAAALYGGPLLDGLTISEPAFENWLAATRTEFHDRACDAFERAARHAADDGALQAAMDTARRLVRLDPVRESGHQLLIRLLYLTGDRASALRHYQVCADTLARELDVTPGAATRQLYEAILRDASFVSGGEMPVPEPDSAPLRQLRFVPPAFPRRNRRSLRTASIWAAMLFGVNLVPWQGNVRVPMDRPSDIEASGVMTLSPVERKAFESAAERDAWYAGARNAVETIYDRRLTAKRTDWDTLNCGVVTASNVRAFCRDIAFQIQLLLQQKATELDALKREYAQASVSPDPHSAPEDDPAPENGLQDTADSRKIGTTAVKDPASAKGAPNSGAAGPASRDSIQREVRSDYAEKQSEPLPDTERAATLPNDRMQSAANKASRHMVAPLARKSAMAPTGTHPATRREPVASKPNAKVELALAPIPGRKPSPPRIESSNKSSENYSNPNRISTVTTVRTLAGTDSKPLLNSKQPQRDVVATAPATSLSHANIDLEKDRDKIELAISDYYFMAKDGQPGNFWGSYVEAFSKFTVKRVHGDQIELLAEYKTSSVNGRVTMNETESGRFLLKKANGAYSVVKMWDGKERGGERIFSASSSQPALTANYDEDREAIRQTIFDYYDMVGHSNDIPDSDHDIVGGMTMGKLTYLEVQDIDGDEIEVLAEYVAETGSKLGSVSMKRKSRFLLKKAKDTFTVKKMQVVNSQRTSNITVPTADLSKEKIDFNKDRELIEQAISDFYDVAGYSKDFPTSVNGAWLDEIRSMSIRNVSGSRIKVDASYTAIGIYSNATEHHEGCFTLTKANGTYRVIAVGPSVGPMANPSHIKLNTKEDRKEIAQTISGNYF